MSFENNDRLLPPPPPPPPPPSLLSLSFEEHPANATSDALLANVIPSSSRLYILHSSMAGTLEQGRSDSPSGSSTKSRDSKHRGDREKSESRKRKREKSKARTLGELVNEAKKRKESSENELDSEEVDEEIVANEVREETRNAQPNTSNDSELPRLSEEELREPVIMNPDPKFDREAMKVKKRSSSTIEALTENIYVKSDGCVYSTNLARTLEERFRISVLDFLSNAKNAQESPLRPPTPPMHVHCKCGNDDNASSSEVSSSSSGEEDDNETDLSKMSSRRRNRELLRREMERKQNHPGALSPDICFNEVGMGNDGPICRCSTRTRSEGIRHNVFIGEDTISPCNHLSNNADRLYHYVLHVNSAVNTPGCKLTQIKIFKDIFEFKGFSIFFHRPLPEILPKMPISRWNTDIDFEFVEEPVPECFTIGELEAFYSYLVDNVLDLFDLPRYPPGKEEGCPIFHVMPRFIGTMEGKSALLSMSKVLEYFSITFRPAMTPELNQKLMCSDEEWQRYCTQGKHQLLMNPQKRPSAIRVDAYTRNTASGYPHLIHNAVRPMAYVSLQTTEQQQAQKRLVKLKKLHKMRKSPTPSEQMDLSALQKKIDDLKALNSMLRNVTVTLSLEPFYVSGFYSDVVSHVLTLSLACHHARLHMSFEKLEENIGYQFSNRALLELALIHPSFKLNYGVNPDHARNTLSNCGFKRRFNTDKLEDIKQLGGGPRMAEYITSRGIKAKTTQVVHNERLEYLGDAVVEMIVTNRLFFVLPHHQEGGLATYRSAVVQNRNLASLAKNIGLQNWLLFTHGPDLCHEADFRHALANAFEALMGAIHLDSNPKHADRIFSQAMYGDDPETKRLWDAINEHELKAEYPDGDRHMIAEVRNLQKLTELEKRIGIEFKHIRVLAKAFTRRSVPWNELTRGHNQRLEWLGDTVLQLIVSDYLYRHFPYHNEGHLSLLRTCLVSNKTQAVICDELGLPEFVIKAGDYKDHKEVELRMKDKADLVESLLGAIFVDKGWEYCKAFIKIMFLPRLKHFLVKKRWADEKSQLQQACISLRSTDSKDTETPTYRVLSVKGPTNSRIYRVGVYFRNTKLAEGTASTLHAAEMIAAKKALVECQELLPDNDRDRNMRSGRQSMTPSRVSTPITSIPSLLSKPLQPPMGIMPPFMLISQPMPFMGNFFQPPPPL